MMDTASKDNDDDDMLYSTRQQQILQWTSCVTGSLSLLGSGWIIYQILSTRPPSTTGSKRRNNNNVHPTRRTTRYYCSVAALQESMYLRLMLGLSCLDILSSLGHVAFGSWTVPSEVDFVFAAKTTEKNWAWCQAGAFFVHQMLGTTLYSAYLAIFFALSIRYEVREEWMAKYLESWMHTTAILFPTVTGAIAVSKDYFSPLHVIPGTSWFEYYPPGCEDVDLESCLRVSSPLMALFCGAIPIVGSVLVSIVCMILLVQKVRQTEQLQEQPPQPLTTTTAPSPPVLPPPQHKNTKSATLQALLYIGVFFLTYFALFVLQIMIQSNLSETADNRTVWFVFAFGVKLFVPLQGALNAFVFWYQRIDSAQQPGALNEFAWWYRRVDHSTTATAVVRKRTNTTNAASKQHPAPTEQLEMKRQTTTNTALSSASGGSSVLGVTASVQEEATMIDQKEEGLKSDRNEDTLSNGSNQHPLGDCNV